MQEYTGEIKDIKEIENYPEMERKKYFSLEGFTDDQIGAMQRAFNRKERRKLKSIFEKENRRANEP